MSRLVSCFFWLLSRLALCVIFYGTPLFGVWLASSLAAYLGYPNWFAWVAGLLMFPVIPGIWELHAWSHSRSDKKPWFTPLDRISLRTFAVGLVFVTVMLYIYPQTAFVALSTRGDWMLDGVKDQRADEARHGLLVAAGAVEWLYKATRTNPYKEHIDAQARQIAEEATKEHDQEVARQREKEATKELYQEAAQQGEKADRQTSNSDQQNTDETDQIASDDSDQPGQQRKKETKQFAKSESQWPWPGAAIDPVVTEMPASAETSINSVAHYIAKHETDPILRVKALHDYVADRVAYDSEALYSGNIPDQSADVVFKNHKSVCAGYANLLSALGKAAGEKIIVVTGDARNSEGDKLSGFGHAWNAARINNQWYLMDACWDSGTVSRDKGFTKRYTTDYLLPPPEVIIQNHFPEDPSWQLLATPLSQAEFLRQPMLSPSFQAANLKLISPRRACSDAGSEAMVIVKNPKNQWLMAGLEQNGNEIGNSTDPINTETAQIVYPLPGKGTYRLNMFINENQQQYGQYAYVGSVDFVNR